MSVATEPANRDQSSGANRPGREVSDELTDTAILTQSSSPINEQRDALPTTCHIAIAAKERWASSGYSALKSIECECNDGVLVIRGVVPSYYFKQMAQESIRSLEGVTRIVNELSVQESRNPGDTRNKDCHDLAE